MTVSRETSRTLSLFSEEGLTYFLICNVTKCTSKGLKKRGRRNRMQGVREIVED